MWWKIYFWIYLVLGIIGAFGILEFSPFGFIDIVGILIGVILRLAIYAFVFNKKIFHKNYWKIMLWVVIFLFVKEMLELYVLPKDFVSNSLPLLKSDFPFTSAEILIIWVISIPGVYALYKLNSK